MMIETNTETEPFLKVRGLAMRYPGLTVFENLDLSVRRGEFVCLIGHSGCGKSTVLHLLAGLDRPSEGRLFVGGREITRPALDRGVIFQNHNLLPWKTTLQNVMFSVRARWPRWSREQIRAHSLRYLELVGLHAALDRKPSQLSGGMRQRVGIARAFALEPELLLMDEPFGALDALTRSVVQDELLKLWAQTGQTAFMITHDVDEAIYLADRVLLMSNGPYARLTECVDIDIPRPRVRQHMIHDPHYYALRTRVLDFLIQHAAGGAQPSAATPAPAASPVLGAATS